MRTFIKAAAALLLLSTAASYGQGWTWHDMAFLASKGTNSGGSTFDPATISGVLFGYAGDDYTSGNWPDKSGHGYTLTQATAAYKPEISATTVNGHALVGFTNTASASYVTNKSFTTSTLPISLFAVCNITNMGKNDAYLIGLGTAGTGMCLDYQAVNARWVSWKPTRFYSTVTTNVLVLMRLYATNNATAQIWVNGTSTTYAGSGTPTDTYISIGGPGDTSSDGIFGQVAEVWGYNAILSTTDETALVNFLTNKYAISW